MVVDLGRLAWRSSGCARSMPRRRRRPRRVGAGRRAGAHAASSELNGRVTVAPAPSISSGTRPSRRSRSSPARTSSASAGFTASRDPTLLFVGPYTPLGGLDVAIAATYRLREQLEDLRLAAMPLGAVDQKYLDRCEMEALAPRAPGHHRVDVLEGRPSLLVRDGDGRVLPVARTGARPPRHPPSPPPPHVPSSAPTSPSSATRSARRCPGTRPARTTSTRSWIGRRRSSPILREAMRARRGSAVGGRGDVLLRGGSASARVGLEHARRAARRSTRPRSSQSVSRQRETSVASASSGRSPSCSTVTQPSNPTSRERSHGAPRRRDRRLPAPSARAGRAGAVAACAPARARRSDGNRPSFRCTCARRRPSRTAKSSGRSPAASA